MIIEIGQEPSEPWFVEARLKDQRKAAGLDGLDGMEADAKARLHVDGTQSVGAEDSDAVLSDRADHFRLDPFPFLAGLGKSPCDEGEPLDALLQALLQNLRRQRVGDPYDGKVYDFGDVLDARIDLESQNILCVGWTG